MNAEASMQTLLDLLDIETIDTDLYRGRCTVGERARVYGGQVAAQALAAAARTVEEGKTVHSLHAYFMRPGDPSIPIIFDVDRLRNGRSFTTRRVRARQRGNAIFTLEASFHIDEPDGVIAHTQGAPKAPSPEQMQSLEEVARNVPGDQGVAGWGELLALDWRVDVPTDLPEAEDLKFWFKTHGSLPNDPVLHAAVLAYASDFTLISHGLTQHNTWYGDPRLMLASLDHTMWFHHDVRADDWLLYQVNCPVAAGGRSLNHGRIFDSAGRLVVSTAQEGLVRTMDPNH